MSLNGKARLAGKTFTTLEAARVLRVGLTAIYRLIEARELEVIRVGTQLRVPATAISTYLNRRGINGS